MYKKPLLFLALLAVGILLLVVGQRDDDDVTPSSLEAAESALYDR